MNRATLSVTVVAFNEEESLRDCLESVKWADEIIVVDSFSTDRTVEIAREYTDKVIQREWPGIIQQKNFAMQQATCDWILNIDADERVSPELAAEIRTILERRTHAEVGYAMPRKTFYLGRWITHGGWYPGRKLRLVRRGCARHAGVNPHDHICADGPVGNLKGDLHHFTYKNLSDHLERINRYTTVGARELNAAGKGAAFLHMMVNPPARFLRMYFLRLGFLDGMPGFIVAVMAAYYVFLKYAKLREMRRADQGSP